MSMLQAPKARRWPELADACAKELLSPSLLGLPHIVSSLLHRPQPSTAMFRQAGQSLTSTGMSRCCGSHALSERI